MGIACAIVTMAIAVAVTWRYRFVPGWPSPGIRERGPA